MSAASQGSNTDPSRSPDGTHLGFARQNIGPKVDALCQAGLFTVNVDGSDLRPMVVPAGPEVVRPQWSPDGSTILFHRAWPDAGPEIFTVGSDGRQPPGPDQRWRLALSALDPPT